jgi:hypothetical protein
MGLPRTRQAGHGICTTCVRLMQSAKGYMLPRWGWKGTPASRSSTAPESLGTVGFLVTVLRGAQGDGPRKANLTPLCRARSWRHLRCGTGTRSPLSAVHHAPVSVTAASRPVGRRRPRNGHPDSSRDLQNRCALVRAWRRVRHFCVCNGGLLVKKIHPKVPSTPLHFDEVMRNTKKG